MQAVNDSQVGGQVVNILTVGQPRRQGDYITRDWQVPAEKHNLCHVVLIIP